MQLHFAIALLVLSFHSLGNAWGGDKIKLKDLSTLTLYHGKMTTARRSHPVPQLNCLGGTAGCNTFMPKVVQCYNKGWDGNDVQWKCETDMDNAYRFGSVEVSCEGYDYPEDPYILKGSCGLEYTIDLTKEGHSQGNAHQTHNYYGGNDHGNKYTTHSSKKSSPFGDFLLLGVVGLVIYALYKTCLSTQVTNGDDTGDGPGGPGRRGWFNSWFGGGGNGYGYQPPPPGFRPEYSGNPGCGNTGGPAAGGGGGGFWTGAATGGLLGYMFGNRMAGDNTYRHGAYPAAGGGGWFQSGRTNYSGYTSTSTAPSPSTGTRTASGFGGTRRR